MNIMDYKKAGVDIEAGYRSVELGNSAAHIPGRCAAMPAPAIMTFMPFPSAALAHSKNTSGSRWAEIIVIS